MEKRMKKLPMGVRVRHWAIEKLGGYSELLCTTRNIHIHTHQENVQWLMAEYAVLFDYVGIIGEDELYEQVKKGLANELAQKMMETGHIVFDCQDDYFAKRRVYTARCGVVPGKTVGWIFGR